MQTTSTALFPARMCFLFVSCLALFLLFLLFLYCFPHHTPPPLHGSESTHSLTSYLITSRSGAYLPTALQRTAFSLEISARAQSERVCAYLYVDTGFLF